LKHAEKGGCIRIEQFCGRKREDQDVHRSGKTA